MLGKLHNNSLLLTQLADTSENMEKVQNELYSIQEQREQERLTLQQKL